MSTRLRSSCDACHTAKVRCQKLTTDGDCERCIAADKPCRFSPALPRGYQKRYSVASSSLEPMTPLSLESEDWSFLLSHDTFEQGIGPSVLAEADSMQAPHSLWPTTSFEPALPLESGATAHDINDPQPSAAIVENQRPALFAEANSTPFDAPELQHRSFSPRVSDRSPRAPANHGSMPPDDRLHAPSSRPACTCLSSILATTQTIHHRLGRASIPLDAILKGNRDAIFLIRSALACPSTCARRNVPFYSIACGCLDMVLTSYQTALRASLAPPPSATASSPSFPKSTAVPAGADGTACQPPVELKFGDFSIGSQDQDFFVRKIFACEISRIEEVVTPGMASAEAWGDGDFTGIFEALRMYLVRRLRLAVEDCAVASKT
ncbi:MAG: hypothetical protein LQ344_001840 [Seirophora lacunosa]|nr:MAG: hypothetical protein LQ344_001840 [Seirophora lacunosa]